MTISSRYGDIEFGGPATYRIVVKGELGQDWSDRLAGLAITTNRDSGASRTTLLGPIRDQSELNLSLIHI